MLSPQLDLPPHLQMMNLATGKWVSKILWAVAKLGVAEVLGTGCKSLKEISQLTDTIEGALFRVLRAGASIGLFNETTDQKFELTTLGSLLKEDHPQSLKSVVLFLNHPDHDLAWNEILYCLRTGKPAFEKVFGMTIFDFFERNQGFANDFSSAMNELGRLNNSSIVQVYDFRGIELLMDVGGGHGSLMLEILNKYVHMRGIVFDLPQVIEGTKKKILAKNLQGRCEAVAGDFFNSLPSSNAIILSHILHGWNDEMAIQIIKKCNISLPRAGRLLVCDAVITPGNHPTTSKLLDIEMLVIPGGKERTEEEFAQLFISGGFRLNRVIATKSMVCILEGYKN